MNEQEFWKWAERVALTGAILGIGVLSVYKYARDWIVRRFRRIRRLSSSAPRDCLRIVPFPERTYWWHQGTSNGKPAMQVRGDWHVTNISNVPIRILRARFVKPSADAFLLVQHPKTCFFGDYAVPPGATSVVSVHVFIEPMPCDPPDDFVTSVVLTDQFGNDYSMKKVIFHCDERTKLKAITVTAENQPTTQEDGGSDDQPPASRN